MDIKGIGHEIIVKLQQFGNYVKESDLTQKIKSLGQNTFKNISTEERLNLDRKFDLEGVRVKLAPVDFQQYFTHERNPVNGGRPVVDSDGAIFTYLTDKLEKENQEEILRLLPPANQIDFSRLTLDQAERLRGIIQKKFPVNPGEAFGTTWSGTNVNGIYLMLTARIGMLRLQEG